MKYYVVSDTHSFYFPMIKALEQEGWFADKEEHKLIMLGDLFDRGKSAVRMEKFVLNLMQKNQIILIKGNHEDYFLDFIKHPYMNYFEKIDGEYHEIDDFFIINKTLSTALQLTHTAYTTLSEADENQMTFFEKVKNTEYYRTIIPAMKNYFETEHYIFVHGWIPTTWSNGKGKAISGWRNKASEEDWQNARIDNGMKKWKDVRIKGKTIVCGHRNASYGHCYYEHSCSEWGKDADFTPFCDNGIIAIDACVAHSHNINCIIVND